MKKMNSSRDDGGSPTAAVRMKLDSGAHLSDLPSNAATPWTGRKTNRAAAARIDIGSREIMKTTTTTVGDPVTVRDVAKDTGMTRIEKRRRTGAYADWGNSCRS